MGFVFLSMIVLLAMAVATIGFVREFVILFFQEMDEKAQKRRAEHYKRLASI